MSVFRSLLRMQKIRFIISGSAAAAIAWTSRILFDIFTNYAVAIALSSVLSVSISFFIYKYFVYKAFKGSRLNQFYRYIFVNFLGATLTLIISITFNKYLSILLSYRYIPEISHLIGIFITAIFNYIMHRTWTFKT